MRVNIFIVLEDYCKPKYRLSYAMLLCGNLTEESKNETEYDEDGKLIKLDFVAKDDEERESSINEEEGRIDYAIREELVLCVDPFILDY